MTNSLFAPPTLETKLSLTGLPGGGSKIQDRSPYAQPGAITGATWKRLPSGLWYLDFDGIDDVVTVGNGVSLRLVGAQTIKGWANLTAVGVDASAIYSRAGSGWATRNSMLWADNTGGGLGRWGAHFPNGVNDWNQVVKNNSVVLNKWTQVVGTWDGISVARLYLDGVLANTNTYAITMTSDTSNYLIGSYGSAIYFKGGIALVQAQSVVWSAIDVQNIFNREKQFFGVW